MAISEWDRRQLCPDGTCVGVIGPEGTCKTCGRVAPDWGDERRRGLVAAPDGDGEDEGEDEGDAEAEEDEISPSAPAAIGEAAEWTRRRLCANGACIGVIGPDGRCKTCGMLASGAEAEEEEEEEDEDDEAEAEAGDEDGEDGQEAEAEDEAENEDEDEDEDEDDAEAADEDADAAELGERKLCPDGACIGVIGPDGHCKICRKEATG